MMAFRGSSRRRAGRGRGSRDGGRLGAVLVPVLLLAVVAAAGLWCLLQAPPDALAYLHELVGVFGLPGAGVLLLAGYALYVNKIRGVRPTSDDDARIMQQIDRLMASLRDDNRSQRQAFNDDLRNALLMVRDQLEIVIKRELDAAEQDRRKSG